MQKSLFFLATVVACSGALLVSTPSDLSAQRLLYRPRASRPIPLNTIPGATRGAKCAGTNCLIALLPPNTVVSPESKANLDHVPLTIADRPTFYVHIPATAGLGRMRLFEVGKANERGKLIYTGSFKVESEAGIVRIPLPASAPALAVDKLYRWELTVGDLNWDGSLVGFVSRVSANAALTKALRERNGIKRAEMMANEGIWIDAVDALVTTPEAGTALSNLLKSVQLEAIANSAIRTCCSPSQ